MASFGAHLAFWGPSSGPKPLNSRIKPDVKASVMRTHVVPSGIFGMGTRVETDHEPSRFDRALFDGHRLCIGAVRALVRAL